jgi:hypothetical protein
MRGERYELNALMPWPYRSKIWEVTLSQWPLAWINRAAAPAAQRPTKSMSSSRIIASSVAAATRRSCSASRRRCCASACGELIGGSWTDSKRSGLPPETSCAGTGCNGNPHRFPGPLVDPRGAMARSGGPTIAQQIYLNKCKYSTDRVFAGSNSTASVFRPGPAKLRFGERSKTAR